MNKKHNTKTSKRKPILIVKPSIINALLPLFFKNLFFFSILSFGAYFLINIINTLTNNMIYSPNINIVLIIITILTLLSVSIKFAILKLIKYSFYENIAVKEFKFIIINKRSVIYSRITNITLKVSLWDRLTRAGTITLHTGDDEMPDIIMKYIKNPERIEELIYSLIHKKNINVDEKIIK